jgi:hypothetical protein
VDEETNLKNPPAQQKVAKKQTSKEYIKVKSTITKSTSFMKKKKPMKVLIAGRVSMAKTIQHASKITICHNNVK